MRLQAAGTCYLHATVSWSASYMIMNNVAATNGGTLDNSKELSVQPFIDCSPVNPSPCDGGYPDAVIQCVVTSLKSPSCEQPGSKSTASCLLLPLLEQLRPLQNP